MQLLRHAHQEANLEAVMCRALISVDGHDYVYDCDFNQMLGLPLRVADKRRLRPHELMEIDLEGNPSEWLTIVMDVPQGGQ